MMTTRDRRRRQRRVRHVALGDAEEAASVGTRCSARSGGGVSINLEYLIQIGATPSLSSTTVGLATASPSNGASSTPWRTTSRVAWCRHGGQGPRHRVRQPRQAPPSLADDRSSSEPPPGTNAGRKLAELLEVRPAWPGTGVAGRRTGHDGVSGPTGPERATGPHTGPHRTGPVVSTDPGWELVCTTHKPFIPSLHRQGTAAAGRGLLLARPCLMLGVTR